MRNKKKMRMNLEFVEIHSHSPTHSHSVPAEEEGFEPPDLLQSTVFKTVAIDHSAILPGQR
jgi:hypothetical protein